MKRIVIASNYDDENFSEEFLNVPPMNHQIAQPICNLLNDIQPAGERYYKVVDPDYKLKVREA